MSQINLQKESIEQYFEKIDKSLKNDFKHYFVEKYFKVGNFQISLGKINHNIIFSNILSEKNCELVNYLEQKLDGTLLKQKYKKKKDTIYNLYHSEQEFLIDTKNYWEKASW